MALGWEACIRSQVEQLAAFSKERGSKKCREALWLVFIPDMVLERRSLFCDFRLMNLKNRNPAILQQLRRTI
jgi:hypothetical protein